MNTKSGILQATYVYDADGNKLRDTSSSTNTSWDYISGIVYQHTASPNTSTILFIQTEEGKASVLSGSTYTYNYEFKDYLGNVRASFDNGGTGGTVRVVQILCR